MIRVWTAGVFCIGGGSVGWSGMVAARDVSLSVHRLVRSGCCVCSVGGYERRLMTADVAHLRMVVVFCFALICRAVFSAEA